MKLLLDAMFAPAIAEQLRRRGRDVIAAADVPALRPLRDPDLFAAAQPEQRAVVTKLELLGQPLPWFGQSALGSGMPG